MALPGRPGPGPGGGSRRRHRRLAGPAAAHHAALATEAGFWSKTWHAGGQFVAEAAEATVDLGQFVFKLTATYALVDPDGYAENLIGLGQGLPRAVEMSDQPGIAAGSGQPTKRPSAHGTPGTSPATATAIAPRPASGQRDVARTGALLLP